MVISPAERQLETLGAVEAEPVGLIEAVRIVACRPKVQDYPTPRLHRPPVNHDGLAGDPDDESGDGTNTQGFIDGGGRERWILAKARPFLVFDEFENRRGELVARGVLAGEDQVHQAPG